MLIARPPLHAQVLLQRVKHLVDLAEVQAVDVLTAVQLQPNLLAVTSCFIDRQAKDALAVSGD